MVLPKFCHHLVRFLYHLCQWRSTVFFLIFCQRCLLPAAASFLSYSQMQSSMTVASYLKHSWISGELSLKAAATLPLLYACTFLLTTIAFLTWVFLTEASSTTAFYEFYCNLGQHYFWLSTTSLLPNAHISPPVIAA